MNETLELISDAAEELEEVLLTFDWSYLIAYDTCHCLFT